MKLSPDGVRYLALGRGERVPRPFNLRWLIPWVCKDNPRRWLICSWLFALVACGGVGLLAHQHHAAVPQSLAAGLLVAGLPSVKYATVHRPVLVDMPSLAVSVWCAVLVPVFWPAAVVLALVSGCVRETGPVWAAVYAWNPLPLSGLVAVILRSAAATGPDVLGPKDAWILQHPFRASLEFHTGAWRDAKQMVLPWGGLLAALWFPSAWLFVALLLAYSQLIVATDTVRLYQQAAPVLAVVAVIHVPWLLPLLVVTWFNPYTEMPNG